MISRDSLKGITSVIAVGLAIFQIYFTAGFGIIDSQLLRTSPPRSFRKASGNTPAGWRWIWS